MKGGGWRVRYPSALRRIPFQKSGRKTEKREMTFKSRGKSAAPRVILKTHRLLRTVPGGSSRGAGKVSKLLRGRRERGRAKRGNNQGDHGTSCFHKSWKGEELKRGLGELEGGQASR